MPTLPDRLTVATCVGCGAMGRAARCHGDCSEHRLPLVAATEFETLRTAGQVVRADIATLEPVAGLLNQTPPTEQRCAETYRTLRLAAAATLNAIAPQDRSDWAAPATRTGWWCAECGNVDAPQPCLDICIWQEVEWVNASLYATEHDSHAQDVRTARALAGILRRVITVTPRHGRYLHTWRALQAEARHALEGGPQAE